MHPETWRVPWFVAVALTAVVACDKTSERGASPRTRAGDAAAAPSPPAPLEAEPWDELPGVAPGRDGASERDPRTPNLDLGALGVASREPPAPRPVAPRLRKRLMQMMLRYKRGDRAGARALAGVVARDPRTRPRDLSALASLGCVECSLTAVYELRRRLGAAGWTWGQTRWLLPLAGHANEQVRVAVISCFLWARAQLASRKFRHRLQTFLRVFRHLAADPSPWVRAEALNLLGRMRDRTAHKLLVASTRDRFPVVRLAAVEAIAEAIRLHPGAPSTQRVCALLDDPSPAVRAAVLGVLPRTRAPCPVTRVVALLGDAFVASLRFATDQTGGQGRRGVRLQVREAAWRALPSAFRAGSDPKAPLARRIAQARERIRQLRPALLAGGSKPALLRPMKPLPAELPALRSPPPGLRNHLATVLASRAPAPIRELLSDRANQSTLARLVPRLPVAQVRRLLQAADVPLRGPLLARALGLLAHADPSLRHAALVRLGARTVDDRRHRVLPRALWLARRDPHPLVRHEALGLLARWHRGSAVRARVVNALIDRHPAVRYRAVRLVLKLTPARARTLLPPRLKGETPALRALLLDVFLRDPALRPPPEQVARYLDDTAPAELVVKLGRREVVVGNGLGSVRDTVVATLESVFGTRHRGSEGARAKRWQDDLLLRGYKLGQRRDPDLR